MKPSPEIAHPILRRPIVLVHGLAGFDEIRGGMLHGRPIRIEYFRGIAEWLRELGAPGVYVARLPPRGSVAERAEALREFVRERVSARRFHLIAHSMGGLDSRHYLTHLDGAARVLTLTTLGTPHRGSPLADVAVETLIAPFGELIRKLGLQEMLVALHRFTAAHHDLRRESCLAFNERTPDAPGVRYFSYGGDPPPEAVNWILRVPHMMLARMGESGEAAANDGLVPLASARWSGWRGTAPADHLSLVGWQMSDESRRRFDVRAFYAGLFADLVEAEKAEE